jgi:hypothetical protein
LHSLLTIIHAKDKKAMTASVEREETRRCGGRERRERASKKRERRLRLRIILQVRIGPELVFFFFLSFSF